MNSRTTRYCIKQGLVNIKRNKLFSIASIGTIAACIFLIGIIFSIIINVNHMEKHVLFVYDGYNRYNNRLSLQSCR